MNNKKIAILGSGSWGVALSVLLNNNGYMPHIWSFSQNEADLINEQRKCVFLPEITLDENIKCSTDFQEVITDSHFILLVTPSHAISQTIKNCKQYIKPEQYVIICSKGIEESSLLTLSEVVQEELPNNKIGVLSGPSHAEEVARSIPTTIVLSSEHDDVLKSLQDIFMSPSFRVYTSKDIVSVEIGGAFKNIMALACGMAAGLGFGDNTFAAIITRGLAELSRLGVKMGGNEKTFYGLTGLGDIIVTCLSEHSRNRKCGYLIGQGVPVEEAIKQVGMVVEGVNATKAAKKIVQKYDVDTPIINATYSVLFEGKDPKEIVVELMTREKKSE